MTILGVILARAGSAGLKDKHANKITSAPIYLVRQAIFLLKLPGGLCWGTHPTVRKHFALAAYAPDPETVRVN